MSLSKSSKSSKSKKPSLSRLTTSLPAAGQSFTSLPPNPKDRDYNTQLPTVPSLFPLKREEENIAPSLRYTPDVKPPVVRQSFEESPLSKVKTSYYEDAFAVRGAHNSPQDRVAQDSVVVAEFTTNHKIKDEGSNFIADFLSRLSQIYQRPEASIMITVHPGTRMIFGSNVTLPVYLLKIYALPSFIAPVTNLRNACLIQNALFDLLGIPPNLGVVIFLPIVEDNFATNGSTIRDEISRLERNDDVSPSFFKSISRTTSRRLKSNSGQSAPFSPSTAVLSPSTDPRFDPLQSPDAARVNDPFVGEARSRRLRKRDSIRAIVRRRIDKIIEKDVKESDGQGQ